MAQAIEFTLHGNQYFVINSMSNLSLIMKLLVEDAMFEYQPGRKSNETKFIDLYLCRSRVIAAGGSLNSYQCRVRGNWKLGCSLDDKLHIVKGDKFDIDGLKKANAFCNSKTNDDDNNINNKE